MMKVGDGFLRRQPPRGRTVIKCACGGLLGELLDDEALPTRGQSPQETRTTKCPGCGKVRNVGIVRQ